MLPLFARKFIVDFAETSIALLFALNVVFPTDVATAQQFGLVVGGAFLSAAVSAARRAAPGFLAWLSARLGVEE